MKVVMLDMNPVWECHKADCKDAVKKLNVSPRLAGVQNHWFEDSLEEAEVNFNEELEELDYNWKNDVEVFPCAKEG